MAEKQTTGDNPEPESAPVYKDIYEVPTAFRTYKSARLSVPQINNIMQDAYDNKIKAGDSLIPDFGGARERFAQGHTIQDGFWISKEDEVSE